MTVSLSCSAASRWFLRIDISSVQCAREATLRSTLFFCLSRSCTIIDKKKLCRNYVIAHYCASYIAPNSITTHHITTHHITPHLTAIQHRHQHYETSLNSLPGVDSNALISMRFIENDPSPDRSPS